MQRLYQDGRKQLRPSFFVCKAAEAWAENYDLWAIAEDQAKMRQKWGSRAEGFLTMLNE